MTYELSYGTVCVNLCFGVFVFRKKQVVNAGDIGGCTCIYTFFAYACNRNYDCRCIDVIGVLSVATWKS